MKILQFFSSGNVNSVKKYAKDGLKLEDQFLGGSVVALFDSDNSMWMRCDDCASSFHVKCCTDSLKM